MTADLSLALEITKFASREVYGVRREESRDSELMKLLNKQMIMQVLSDSACLKELTIDEQTALSAALILRV